MIDIIIINIVKLYMLKLYSVPVFLNVLSPSIVRSTKSFNILLFRRNNKNIIMLGAILINLIIDFFIFLFVIIGINIDKNA